MNRLSMFVYTSGNPTLTVESEEQLLQSSDRTTRIHAAGWVGFKPSDYNNGVSTWDSEHEGFGKVLGFYLKSRMTTVLKLVFLRTCNMWADVGCTFGNA